MPFSSFARATLAFMAFVAVVPARAAAPRGEAAMRKFLDSYCVSCHDAATKKGGLDLEALPTDYRVPATFETWIKVHDRLQAGDMPPKARKERPSAAESATTLNALATSLATTERNSRKADGRASFRRLNRSEYEHTLRDLLHLPGLAIKDLLPEDGRAFGFDKSAAGLDLSHVQLAKYLEAAEVALTSATAPHAAPPEVFKERLYPGAGYDFKIVLTNGDAVFLKDGQYDPVIPIVRDRSPISLRQMEQEKKLPYKGTVGVFRHEDEAFLPRFHFAPLYSGRYRLRVSLWSFFWDKGNVKPQSRMEVASLIAEGRTLGYFDAPSVKPTVHEVEVWLNAGEMLRFNAASLWPTRVSERPGRAAEYQGPGIAVDWLDVEGPLLDQWPPAGHRALYGDLGLAPIPKGKAAASDPRLPKREMVKQTKPGAMPRPGRLPPTVVVSAAPETDARRLLNDFLRRAFRRNVVPEEQERYVGLFKAHLAAGAGFEEAMRTAYKAVLCSPEFLFLKEPVGKLSAWAVASRLSYFLWNSMPDDELLELAQKNKLHDKSVLREQTERMLKDPKAERFVRDFTDQWLDMREIDATCPDRRLYPEFRPILRDAMLAETRAFFTELLAKDLPTATLVDSDFAMLNQRFAEHYRIPGVEGAAIRRVALPTGAHRGGVLTQASVLKVTANGTTTSPVKRGAWVQRKIVGQPPEPPPDVPAIEPDTQGTTTVREMLAKHRSNASCASCHAKIDPPGFALESYDVIGGWQTRYRSLGAGDKPDPAITGRPGVPYKVALAVDAAGETADGKPFKDVEGFKKLLLADARPLARNLVGQLVVYATGAPVGFADREVVKSMLDRTAGGHYGVRSLIHEVVESPLFLTK